MSDLGSTVIHDKDGESYCFRGSKLLKVLGDEVTVESPSGETVTRKSPSGLQSVYWNEDIFFDMEEKLV